MSYRIRLEVYWQEQYVQDLLSGSHHTSLEEAEASFFDLYTKCCTLPNQYRISLLQVENDRQRLLKKVVAGKP